MVRETVSYYSQPLHTLPPPHFNSLYSLSYSPYPPLLPYAILSSLTQSSPPLPPPLLPHPSSPSPSPPSPPPLLLHSLTQSSTPDMCLPLPCPPPPYPVCLCVCLPLAAPRVRPFTLVLKKWAQHYGINDASKGTLSSYTLVLMVLHYLQSEYTNALWHYEGVA